MYQRVPASVINSFFDRATLPAIDEKIRLTIDVEVTKIGQVDSILSTHGDPKTFKKE